MGFLLKKLSPVLWFWLLLVPNLGQASCLGNAWSEFLLPGSGYAASGQWGKALGFGALRWAAAGEFYRLRQTEDLIPPDERFEISESPEGKPLLTRHNNAAMQREYMAFNWFLDPGFLSFWDLQAHNCQANDEVWKAATAPLQFDHYSRRWGFWLGLGAMVAFYQAGVFNELVEVRDEFHDGYTPAQHNRDSLIAFYPVGIGEEAMFRGSLQESLFQSLEAQGWSPEAARHGAIWSAAAIFGALHSGSAPTAAPWAATLFGAYNGYLYQPGGNERDLITAMAFHTWFDTINAWLMLQHSKQSKRGPWRQPLASLSFRF